MYYWYMQKDVNIEKHPQGSFTKIWYPIVSSLARNGTLVDKDKDYTVLQSLRPSELLFFFSIFAASLAKG